MVLEEAILFRRRDSYQRYFSSCHNAIRMDLGTYNPTIFYLNGDEHDTNNQPLDCLDSQSCPRPYRGLRSVVGAFADAELLTAC